jgi:hypothetical protein
MNKETTMTDLNTIYAGCTAFALNWTGEAEVDRNMVDLLAMAAQTYYSHLEQGKDCFAELALESSSTYVQCDLSSDELEEYVALFEDFLCQASEGEFDEFDWEKVTYSEDEMVA